MVNREIGLGFRQLAQLAQRNQRTIRRLDPQGQQIGHAGAFGAGQADGDFQRLPFGRLMHRPGHATAHGDAQGIGDVLHGDPMQGGPLSIQPEADFGLGRVHQVVGIGHAFDLLDVGAYLAGDFGQFCVVFVERAIDLGHEGGQHRRTRRGFDNLGFRAMGLGDALNVRANAQGDLVGLLFPLFFGQQVDANLPLPTLPAQIIVAN